MILEKKVALVTGSSRGIGAATVILLASQGARVVINFACSGDHAQQVSKKITAQGGECLTIQADVTDPQQITKMVDEVITTWGTIDILVNNANMHFPMQPFTDYSWEDFERKLTNELKASFFCCKAVVPTMIEKKRGCIINVSSGLSRAPGPGFIAHSSAKAALDAFSRSLAQELGPLGIRVNVVSPGLTITDATAHIPPAAKEAAAQHTPLKRVAQPEDIAGAILFYCTEWSQFITGTYLPVSGGTLMI